MENFHFLRYTHTHTQTDTHTYGYYIIRIIILPAVVAVMLGSLGQNSIFHIYGTFVFERNLTRLDPKFRTSQRPIRLERWSQNVVMLKNKKNIA